MLDKLKDKSGKEHVVFVCEFRDGLAPLVYITADGQLKDFCRDHYWGAIQQEVDVVRAGVRQQTFAELKAKRLEELSK